MVISPFIIYFIPNEYRNVAKILSLKRFISDQNFVSCYPADKIEMFPVTGIPLISM